MRLRESGMPDMAVWESLLDTGLIVERLGIDEQIGDAIELGCGYGTFTRPVAAKIAGTLRAFDIDVDMVARTQRRVEAAALGNVVCTRRDVAEDGFGVAPGSQDACLLFNILHGEEPVALLREARHCLRPSGLLFVIHWRHDPDTPRGPSMAVRPRPEQILSWAELAGLEPLGDVLDLPPWHYGLTLRVAANEPSAMLAYQQT